MADISRNTESKYLLNGIETNAPLEWQDVTIEAQYPDDSVQPNLTITEFDFNLESRKAINDWILGGTSGGVGIFEGMPFDLNLFNNNPLTKNFKAFIDFTNSYNDQPDDGVVSVSIIKDDSIQSFFDKLNGTTCGYLEEIGVFVDSDYVRIPYVVEKKFNFFEILITSIVLYLMVKELEESIYRTAEAISTASGIFSAGFTGSVGSAIYLFAIALVNIAYTAILLIAIVELSITLFETLIPPQRTHKGILLKTALTKISNHFGYQFNCPVEEYNNVTYLPSNPNLDEKAFLGFINVTKGTQSGIPNNLDYGYFTEDLFKLAKDLPFAKMALIGNTIELRAKNDPFWVQQSQWQIPDVKINTLTYNVNELNATNLVSFGVDTSDEWTIDNYEKTAIEIKTEPISVINQRAVLLKGLDEVNFECALGTRKNRLNAIENLLKNVAGAIDKVTGIFGGGTNFKSKVTTRIGVLKQSTNWHTIPKLLYLNGGRMPINHKSLWNAEVLWEKYHDEKSFIANNYKAQKQVYNQVSVPFGLEDFFKLTTNPYFIYKGNTAKIVNFTWTVGEDVSVIDFWVRKPYTFNLKETKIIPK